MKNKIKFNLSYQDVCTIDIIISTIVICFIGILFCVVLSGCGNEPYTNLTKQEQNIENVSEVNFVQGTINSTKAKLMTKPSSDSEEIMTVREGDSCVVYDEFDYGWYYVSVNGTLGYIYRMCVDLDLNTNYTNIKNKFPSIDIAKSTELVYPSTNVLSSDKLNYDSLTSTVAIIAPDLISITEALLYNYESYGLKPSFQLAVFCTESDYGRSDLANVKNNICGFNAYATSTETVFEHATQFSTKSDCVYEFGRLINDAYVTEGLNSIETISTKYCPPNSQNWVRMVTEIQTKIESIYNSFTY